MPKKDKIKVYKYFVSYAASGDKGAFFGNCEIDSNQKIEGNPYAFKLLNHIRDDIEIKSILDGVIILNYQLIGEFESP